MDRREQMRRWLARRERRGLTFLELSEETGVPAGTLGSWAWRLRREAEDSSSVGRRRGSFVELVAEPDRGGGPAGIVVVVAGGRRVLVSEEVDEDQLVRVVRALERC